MIAESSDLIAVVVEVFVAVMKDILVDIFLLAHFVGFVDSEVEIYYMEIVEEEAERGVFVVGYFDSVVVT